MASQDLHKIVHDVDVTVRCNSANSLGLAFPHISDGKCAQQDYHDLVVDLNVEVRCSAASAFKLAYIYFPDKDMAFSDIIILTKDKYSIVRVAILESINSVFPYIEDKNSTYLIISSLVIDSSSNVRKIVAETIGSIYPHLLDRMQAWKDLIALAEDENRKVRLIALDSLSIVLQQFPEKDRAWQDILRLIKNRRFYSGYTRKRLVKYLGYLFPYLLRKDSAYQDIRELIREENRYVREGISEVIEQVFPYFTKKDAILNDLINLTRDSNIRVRETAIKSFGSVFASISDKSLACQYLHHLCLDNDKYVLKAAIQALSLAFPYIPDKNQAWRDMHQFIQHEDAFIKMVTGESLGMAFPYVPNKNLAWSDIQSLAKYEDCYIREATVKAIKVAFPHVPDRNAAWQELIDLTDDENSDVLDEIAESIKAVFPHVPDKNQAWSDLLNLIKFKDGYVVDVSAEALGSIFKEIPDRISAWRDLIDLVIKDKYIYKSVTKTLKLAFPDHPDRNQGWKDLIELLIKVDARESISDVMGSAFPHIPERDLAWNDLQLLTESDNREVRMVAYYNLGRASVLKATETEDKDIIRKELEKAVDYYEKSSLEFPMLPAEFCCAFYRSYIGIIFRNATDMEVENYIIKAKSAVGYSETREELFETLNNLAMALRQSQKLRNTFDSKEIINNINVYRWFCEKTAELMSSAEIRAPLAVKLFRKCNPVIEKRIQKILVEIRENAKEIYKITVGTEFAEIGARINAEANYLSGFDIESIQKASTSIASNIMDICNLLPKNKRGLVCEVAKEVRQAKEFPEKLEKIDLALGYIVANFRSSREYYQESLCDTVILTVLPEEYHAICNKISNLGPPPRSSLVLDRYAWKFGEVPINDGETAKSVAVGMIGRPGAIQSALATYEAMLKWNPHNLMLVGVAGGFSDLQQGDVVIADLIHGYEYGKIDEGFLPRDDWTYRTNHSILTKAKSYALSQDWLKFKQAIPPTNMHISPKVIFGEIASGEKVIDNPNDPFFARVLKRWPKVVAVEMEAAGVGNAMENIKGILTTNADGFTMIRGISDLPLSARGTNVRDDWKPYASDMAAAFAIGLISNFI